MDTEEQYAATLAMLAPMLLEAAKAVLDTPYLQTFRFEGSPLDRLGSIVHLIENGRQ